MKLTKVVLDQACYEGSSRTSSSGREVFSRHVLWDDDVHGLGLRLFPSGKKSFVLLFRAGGHQHLMNLGTYGSLTLQQARAKAQQMLGGITIEGRNPLAEKKTARAKGITVAELADRYLEEHASVKKKASSAKTDKQMLRDYVLPKLGHIAVRGLTWQDVAALHHTLRLKPYVANRVLALVSKMLNLAEKWGLRDDGSNPCRHVEKFKERQRERYLTSEELTNLTRVIADAEINGTESVHALAALRLLILTGCRLREILRLRWEHVDFEHCRLNLPDSKTGAKLVFLSTMALDVLASTPRANGSPWVIEGKKPGSHLSDPKGPWRRISAAAGLTDVRIHDLRHYPASRIIPRPATAGLCFRGKSRARAHLGRGIITGCPERPGGRRRGGSALGFAGWGWCMRGLFPSGVDRRASTSEWFRSTRGRATGR
ncbi:MAG: site-specific integrase [Thermoanaerobaculia bacterium]|nr:site-specific integrase [Thermoanaerobaculia bacterium]